MEIPEALAAAAAYLASEINADAMLALMEDGRAYNPTFQEIFDRFMIRNTTNSHKKRIKFVIATSDQETYEKLSTRSQTKVIKLALQPPGRISKIQHAICSGVQKGVFWPGELIVCLTGDGFLGGIDTLFVHRVVGSESTFAEMIESDPVLCAVVEIAMELGRDGYHGQPIGTAFMVGDSKAVLRLSNQLMLNPFRGHPPAIVTDRKDKEIIKKYAVFDGAFIVNDDGRVLAAGRYLSANAKVDIPRGLGTRHTAVAAMTAATNAKGVTVSGEDGAVRIFEHGELKAKINPKSKTLTEILIE